MHSLDIIHLVIGDYSCEILANYGATLNSYKYKGLEFVDGYSEVAQTKKQQYKGVILAPFPNRIAQGIYNFEGATYQLPINRSKEGLALHGFLYNKTFSVVNQTTDSVSLEYLYEEELPSFPFSFKLCIHYQLKEDGSLIVSSDVWNNSTSKMPFGLGWHPYFKIGDSIDHLSLDFPASKQVLLDEKKIPNGKQSIFLSQQDKLYLRDHQFDDCFILEAQEYNEFVLSDGINSLKVFSPSKADYGFFQIYTPKDRKTIAIEPMTCAPDAFNNNIGLHLLEPEAHSSFRYGIKGT